MTEEPKYKLTPEDIELRYKILKGCVNRMDALGFKGKKREEMALNYVIGAVMLLHSMNHPLYGFMEPLIVLVFSTRGTYSESKKMVLEHEAAQLEQELTEEQDVSTSQGS